MPLTSAEELRLRIQNMKGLPFKWLLTELTAVFLDQIDSQRLIIYST